MVLAITLSGVEFLKVAGLWTVKCAHGPVRRQRHTYGLGLKLSRSLRRKYTTYHLGLEAHNNRPVARGRQRCRSIRRYT